MNIEHTQPENSYDLCVLWNWEYDADFVKLLQDVCSSCKLSLLQVTPENLADMLNSLNNRKIGFRIIMDRAAEDDSRFMPFVEWACEHSAYYINHHERATRSWNKSIMHYALIKAGIHTPYTIILPSYEEHPNGTTIDLKPLGERFIIKPIYGSGGEGVVMNVTSSSQVDALRQKHTTYKYMLQTFIEPRKLNSHPAWFRVIYCSGRVYPCWWNPETHIYIPVTASEESLYGLGPLYSITTSIANLCGLDLFSTEIAFSADNLFVVVDYVNDQPDLRLQSKAMDGVPNAIVHDIVKRLCDIVTEHNRSFSDCRDKISALTAPYKDLNR